MSRPFKLKASFVIPAYNAQADIANAIRSCLNQTQPGIEIIVVDDASTDSTKDRIKYFAEKDKRVRPIYLETNIGRSLARNRGIQEAKADILLMQDADDVSLPTRVADVLNYLKKNPTVDLFYGHFHPIDQFGQIIDNPLQASAFDFEKVKKTGFTYIGHSTMGFKKSVFEKVQYTDGDFSRNGIDDWKFQVDAFNAGFRFGVIDRVLAQYRWDAKPRDEKKIKELKQSCLN